MWLIEVGSTSGNSGSDLVYLGGVWFYKVQYCLQCWFICVASFIGMSCYGSALAQVWFSFD